MTQRKKIVFITGFGRSGTTLLGNLLGQMEGWYCAGEPGFLFEQRILDNSDCSCGHPYQTCPVWKHVTADYSDLTKESVQKATYERASFKNRHCWLQLTQGGRRYLRNKTSEKSKQFAELYSRLSKVTGDRIIVDSTKMPSHGYLLQQIDDIDLYIVHVVRDPRAVAFSWQKNNKIYDILDGTPRYFQQFGVVQCTLAWLWWNLTIEFLWGRGRSKQYLRIRYEDLIKKPKETLSQISTMVGDHSSLEFFEDEHTLMIKPQHIFAGNPARFQKGKTSLVLDEQWRYKMPFIKKIIAEILSFPLAVKYRYLS